MAIIRPGSNEDLSNPAKQNDWALKNGYQGWSDYQDKIRQEQDANDPTKLAATQRAAMDTRFNQNRNDITKTIDTYKTAIPGIQQAADTKYGVSNQLGLVNALETRINDLKFNTSGAGAGGVASASQVDKAVNSKYLPQYNTANTNLGRSATLAANEVSQQLDPYKTQISALNDQIARESTGYTQEQQNELTVLLTKMNQGFALTQAEIAQVNALALADKNYANQVSLLEKQNEQKKNDPSNRYISLGTNDQLYDVVTGKIVAKNSASTTGGSTSNYYGNNTPPQYSGVNGAFSSDGKWYNNNGTWIKVTQ